MARQPEGMGVGHSGQQAFLMSGTEEFQCLTKGTSTWVCVG